MNQVRATQSYLRFQIAMTDSLLMQQLKSFQDLFRDLSSVRFRDFAIHHISAQVSLADVLHCKKDFVRVFVPAKELNKQMTVLECQVC